jgi:hypothetical protein
MSFCSECDVSAQGSVAGHMDTRNPFPVLTFVSRLLRSLGWLLAVNGILYAVIAGIIEPSLPNHMFAASDVFDLFTGAASAVVGIIVVGYGELIGVAFAIEANTRSTAGLLENLMIRMENRQHQTEPSRKAPPSDFTYMCRNCSTFQSSDVLSCLNCGEKNPYHPANKSEASSENTPGLSSGGTSVDRCMRCGAGIEAGDKFCSSCGHGRA